MHTRCSGMSWMSWTERPGCWSQSGLAGHATIAGLSSVRSHHKLCVSCMEIRRESHKPTYMYMVIFSLMANIHLCTRVNIMCQLSISESIYSGDGLWDADIGILMCLHLEQLTLLL